LKIGWGLCEVGQVLTIVQGHGYAIQDVSTLEPDLEDVFVSLTGAG
jgi:ABC-2 type transport system ATP-binding protein|tara:strand:- start:256 stop:393 length:138 start_codon:yes stop_codon:yes gene_type:complete